MNEPVFPDDVQRLVEPIPGGKPTGASLRYDLVYQQGIRAKVDAGFGRRLETLKLWDGSPLPEELRGKLLRSQSSMIPCPLWQTPARWSRHPVCLRRTL